MPWRAFVVGAFLGFMLGVFVMALLQGMRDETHFNAQPFIDREAWERIQYENSIKGASNEETSRSPFIGE